MIVFLLFFFFFFGSSSDPTILYISETGVSEEGCLDATKPCSFPKALNVLQEKYKGSAVELDFYIGQYSLPKNFVVQTSSLSIVGKNGVVNFVQIEEEKGEEEEEEVFSNFIFDVDFLKSFRTNNVTFNLADSTHKAFNIFSMVKKSETCTVKRKSDFDDNNESSGNKENNELSVIFTKTTFHMVFRKFSIFDKNITFPITYLYLNYCDFTHALLELHFSMSASIVVESTFIQDNYFGGLAFFSDYDIELQVFYTTIWRNRLSSENDACGITAVTESSLNVTMYDLHVVENFATPFSFVSKDNLNFFIDRTIFRNNMALHHGGGISITNDEYCMITILNCEFSNNEAPLNSGAIFGNLNDVILTISNTQFLENRASEGASIWILAESMYESRIDSNTIFDKNQESVSTYISTSKKMELTIEDVKVSGKRTGVSQLGMSLYATIIDLVITNSIFERNMGALDIMLMGGSHVSIEVNNCSFIQNKYSKDVKTDNPVLDINYNINYGTLQYEYRAPNIKIADCLFQENGLAINIEYHVNVEYESIKVDKSGSVVIENSHFMSNENFLNVDLHVPTYLALKNNIFEVDSDDPDYAELSLEHKIELDFEKNVWNNLNRKKKAKVLIYQVGTNGTIKKDQFSNFLFRISVYKQQLEPTFYLEDVFFNNSIFDVTRQTVQETPLFFNLNLKEVEFQNTLSLLSSSNDKLILNLVHVTFEYSKGIKLEKFTEFYAKNLDASYNSKDKGGAIYLNFNNFTKKVQFDTVSLMENSATYGGALFFEGTIRPNIIDMSGENQFYFNKADFGSVSFFAIDDLVPMNIDSDIFSNKYEIEGDFYYVYDELKKKEEHVDFKKKWEQEFFGEFTENKDISSSPCSLNDNSSSTKNTETIVCSYNSTNIHYYHCKISLNIYNRNGNIITTSLPDFITIEAIVNSTLDYSYQLVKDTQELLIHFRFDDLSIIPKSFLLGHVKMLGYYNSELDRKNIKLLFNICYYYHNNVCDNTGLTGIIILSLFGGTILVLVSSLFCFGFCIFYCTVADFINDYNDFIIPQLSKSEKISAREKFSMFVLRGIFIFSISSKRKKKSNYNNYNYTTIQ